MDKNFWKISLLLRLSSILLVTTWFVPDEYWQSLEIAHLWTFSYGYKTWEWTANIRSTLHPLIFYLIYQCLNLTGFDNAFLLINLPRIFQALLSSYADYCLYKWANKSKLFTFLLLSSWFWFYTCSRTLINTFEMCLTSISLRFFPWNTKLNKDNNNLFIVLSCLICCIRPTAVTVWLPMYTYHICVLARNPLKTILTKYIPISLSVLILSIAIDSMFYGTFTCTPLNFFMVNVMSKISSNYGVEPWFWYFTSGLPTLLGSHYFLLVMSIFYRNRTNSKQVISWIIVIINMIIFSLLPHKEFRFLLPLMPFFLYIISSSLWKIYRKMTKTYKQLIIFLILLSNVIPALYFGLIHQSGTTNLMLNLNKIAENDKNNISVMFLMPCHSTPFYSHIHKNVSLKFLTCEPNIYLKPNYRTETEVFFENPEKWIRTKLLRNHFNDSYVIYFDNLSTNISKLFRNKYIIF